MHCCAARPICKSSAAIFIPTPWCIRFCHSRKAAIMSSLNPLRARGSCGNSAHSTYRNVILSECNPNLADPPGLWVIIPFRFGTPYWTAIGQSTCRSVFGATCPINETSVGNDDPDQPCTSLAVCAKWLVIDRHARYMRCLRESLREQ